MNFKKLVQHFIIHNVVLTLFLFFVFYNSENADLNTTIGGTLLYLSYLLAFTGFNMCLIILGLILFQKKDHMYF